MSSITEKLKFSLKNQLLKFSGLERMWTFIRACQLNKDYLKRREYYSSQAARLNLRYSSGQTELLVRERLAQRGHTPSKRELGDVHTFAFIPDLGWHKTLLPEIEELGPTTWFDYVKEGYSIEEFFRRDDCGLSRRSAMNQAFIEAVVKTNEKKPIDWVFAYASGVEISRNSIEEIHRQIGIPTVCMCLDDKQSWTGPWMGDHQAGQIALAPAFDLSWTSAKVACEWYLVEGGRPLFLPEGFAFKSYKRLQRPKDILVSFVGARYGYRARLIEKLRSYNIPVQVFGQGWQNSGWVSDINEIFNRSLINFGMGGIGYLQQLNNLKGRDFEIPGSGGGAYLTSFNPDLAAYFQIGKEILCYYNEIDAVETIRDLIAHPESTMEIADLARTRAINEHRWKHRFIEVLRTLGILKR